MSIGGNIICEHICLRCGETKTFGNTADNICLDCRKLEHRLDWAEGQIGLLRVDKSELEAKVESLSQQLQDEIKTVCRVWNALGVATYADVYGKEISQIVRETVEQLSEAKKALHECFVVMAGKEGTNAPFDVKRWSAAVTEAAKYWDRNAAQEAMDGSK